MKLLRLFVFISLLIATSMLSAWNISAQAPPPTPVGPLKSDEPPPQQPSKIERLAAGEFSVDSKVGWQQTSLSLQKGDEFKIKYISGTWTVDYRSFTYVGPKGYTRKEDRLIFQGCKLNSSWVYARLVGKVGNGDIFAIDRGGSFKAKASGDLSLRIHDVDACLVDNDGSVVVEIKGKEEVSPGSQFQFDDLPVKFSEISWVNWYGNTEFAYQNRCGIYLGTQGLHSGLDFVVPQTIPNTEISSVGTIPIRSVVNRTGTVISVSNNTYPWGAGKDNVAVDYTDYIVLYGHTAPNNLPQVGTEINPGDVVAYVGSDGRLVHLHLEIIIKDSTVVPGKPGNHRTNPVPFFFHSKNLRDQLKEKAAGPGAEFHKPTPKNQWQKPEDQPIIKPEDGLYSWMLPCPKPE